MTTEHSEEYYSLSAKIKRLTQIISPLANPAHVSAVRVAMETTPLDRLPLHEQVRKGKPYYRVYLVELWEVLFETTPTQKDLTDLGRSLQALLWERSALNGTTAFMKSKQEFISDGH